MFFNFIQSSKSADFHRINNNENDQGSQINWSKISNNKTLFKSSKLFPDNNFEENLVKEKSLEKNSELFLTESREKQEELVIQSDKQFEKNNVTYAEGNVSVSYRGNLLRSDNLIYDKSNKKISAEGNIVLTIGNQIFKLSKLEYNFISEKGYLKNVEGFLKTNRLIDDLLSNFNFSDINKLENLLDLRKKEVLTTPGRVDNWIFSTDKMTIDGKKWKSKKAVFSNDLLELRQVKLAINSLEVIPEAERLRFKSSLNYLIFEEKVSIPFWLGDRTLTKSDEFFNFENRWNLGYDNLDKDGYFIGNKLKSINISNNFTLDLEPQFLFQRSLKGYTKSFVKEGESITSEKVKRDTSIEDYFALNSQIKGRINKWDLEIDKNLNSLDLKKFSDAFRLKTTLSKKLIF